MRCLKFMVATDDEYLKAGVVRVIHTACRNLTPYMIINGDAWRPSVSAHPIRLGTDTTIFCSASFLPAPDSLLTPQQVLAIPRRPDSLLQLINQRVLGYLAQHPGMVSPLAPLSLREFRVLSQVMGGNTLGVISRRENLSVKTVSAYKRRAMAKLDARNLQQLYYTLIAQ